LVLYFYPKDMTPGCTTQAATSATTLFLLSGSWRRVLGISVDDVESHKKFAEEHGLPFPILADSSKQTTRLWSAQSLFGMKLAVARPSFIDPHGKIVKHYPQSIRRDTRRSCSRTQALQKSGA